ncbi:ribonuclease J [Christensenellaceae bacterium NSJ-63]|uniref:Ribonuclease J n=1 Tax=Guopingia tenuis TaxID=2763656 RepID=A0A926DF23_9FIRM|nr:ribonuclease J [Guopingia tenuis]MBC8537458.1 ribonuclease J [Guopingia tenuis]
MTQKKTAQKKAPQQKKNEGKKTAGKRTGAGSRKLKIIPLGGIGEVGKNMTVVEWQNNILVIDCGMMFPKEEMFGVDYVIPDITYLTKNADKIKGFVITHGHEDHIGATPYVLDKFNVPVYGTRLTLALIETKLAERGVKNKNLRCIQAGEKVKCGCFEIEFIKVSHSIDDAVGIAIHTPEGVIVHTGDFKVDYTPIDGKVIDLNKFGELGKEGVLALMSDSTNAERPGFTISEKSVGATFSEYFKDAKGRIIIATFASNIHRLQQVIDEAKRYNRKICLSGRSMVRMASGEHAKLGIKAGDTVIISSTPIPGNERYVSDVINMLFRKGANVVYGKMAQVHVSGHACQEELKLMLSLTKPQYFIPVHGEYRQIYNHAALAYDIGMKKKDVFIPEIGRAIELTRKSAQFGETVPSGIVMIDGLGIGDVGDVVLRDRKLLSQDGLFIVVVTVSKENAELVSGPEIISRGFVYMKESEDLLDHARDIVKKIVADCGHGRVHEWMNLKGKIKKSLSSYLYNMTKRSPMILPIVIEV